MLNNIIINFSNMNFDEYNLTITLYKLKCNNSSSSLHLYIKSNNLKTVGGLNWVEIYLFEDIISDPVVETQRNPIINIEFLSSRSDVDRLRRTRHHYEYGDAMMCVSRSDATPPRRSRLTSPIRRQWRLRLGTRLFRSEDSLSFWFLVRVIMSTQSRLFLFYFI